MMATSVMPVEQRAETVPISKAKLWAGRVLTGLSVAFLLLDSLMKVAAAGPAVEGTVKVGYPADSVRGMGVTLLVCVLAYAIPRTSVLGAILLTGYLGGAVATHVRLSDPLFSHVLFPVYVGAMVWGGLYLRDARLRALLPLRK